MQRRVVPSTLSRPHGRSHNSSATRTTNDDYRGGKPKNGGASPLITVLIISFLLIMAVMISIFFPAELRRAEEEAGRLAQKAMDVEHNMAERMMGPSAQKQPPLDSVSLSESSSANMEERLAASHAATARMEAQSSRWVDGEKKLKQKLQVLYDRQQQGHDLGVPVLTRWLGDDFPAYVTPDMGIDVAVWKKEVEAKYAEMRKEEEEWQAKMNTIIQQRERDIGITTA
ncbi:hypothetical protein IV203_010439 [Nitzschia inconspicua]|uniref:Uncharacterized protein n=1 Tax=Nitzschia inconspicua TaxID=303405 RepID=A0A9K3KW15_9STRA|nr:hypothetical protein IV203_010439 [Nitzschia inconspicua]